MSKSKTLGEDTIKSGEGVNIQLPSTVTQLGTGLADVNVTNLEH